MTFRVSLVLLWWIRSFAFTLAAEAPVYVLASRRVVPAWRACLAGMACSAITHPLLWFVWPRVIRDYATYIATGELLVAVIESLVFFLLCRPIRFSRAVAASFLANAFSYGLGLALRALGLPI